MGEAAQVALRSFEEFDLADPESFASLCSEDLVLYELSDVPDSGVFRGKEGAREWVAKVAGGAENITFEASGEVIERGDRAAVETTGRVTGREGIAAEMSFWVVCEARDGLLTYHRSHRTREQALEDLEKAEA